MWLVNRLDCKWLMTQNNPVGARVFCLRPGLLPSSGRSWVFGGVVVICTRRRGKLRTGFEENPAGWNGAFYHGNCPPLHKLSCKTSISSPRESLMGHNWLNYADMRGSCHILEGIMTHRWHPEPPWPIAEAFHRRTARDPSVSTGPVMQRQYKTPSPPSLSIY